MHGPPKRTVPEWIRIAWRTELRIGDPLRIIRTALATVYYGAIWLLLFKLPNKMIELGKRLIK